MGDAVLARFYTDSSEGNPRFGRCAELWLGTAEFSLEVQRIPRYWSAVEFEKHSIVLPDGAIILRSINRAVHILAFACGLVTPPTRD